MKVAVINVPYDGGRFTAGCGLGPVAIGKAGLSRRLREAGHDVTETTLLLDDQAPREISTGFAVAAAIAAACEEAVARQQFPLVIAGNCLSAVGMCAAIRADSALWFDAHADLHTPDTTSSGMLDGMALAAVLGRCFPHLTARVPGHAALPPERVILVDARDTDPAEAEYMAQAGVRRVEVGAAREAATSLAEAGAQHLYLHLDLDIHDPAFVPVNRFAVAGGPSPEAMQQAVRDVAVAIPLAGAALTSYDPIYDPDGRMAEAAVQLALALIGALAEGRVVQALNSAIRL